MANYYHHTSNVIGAAESVTTGLNDINWTESDGQNLYAFTSFQFGTANLTGREGPTRTQLLAFYDTTTYSWLNDTAFFDVDSTAQGVQMFTVPSSGTYRITARGASGGYSYDTATQTRVGKGATVRAEFSLAGGDILRIVVGQKGRPVSTANPDGPLTGQSYNSGGGGGSFVFYTLADSEPLLVAGGGGGGSYSGTSTLAPDASFALSGAPGTGVDNDGAGTFSGLVSGQSLGFGGVNNGANAHRAGCGAGWKGNGFGGHTICSVQSPFHVQGGWSKSKSYDNSSSTTNGGPFVGGWGGNNQAGNGSQQGGFGGGGGGTGRCGSCQAGGGGGYSGGGFETGSTNSSPTKEALAGGGNYVNSAGANGTFVSFGSAGADGYVLVELI